MLTVLRKVTRYSTALLILLGILLIPVAMVVDLLFPGTTDIVANLSNLVNQFIDGGLVGTSHAPVANSSSAVSRMYLMLPRCASCLETRQKTATSN